MALSYKRRAFVEEYLQCWNAAEAARRAGYSERTARSQGQRLLTNVDVQEEIQTRLAKKTMAADEVLARLTEQGRAEYSNYFESDGTVDLKQLLANGKGHLIKGIKWDRNGNLVVEFYDAQSALVHLGRHHGLFTDNLKHSGSVGFDLDSWKNQRQERLAELEDLEDLEDLDGGDECAATDE